MAANQLPTITPRYILETRRYLAMAVGVGVVAALLVVIGFVPQIQAILELQNDTVDKQEQVTRLEQKVRQLEQVLDPELLSQIETVDLLLPSHKPLLELLASLDRVASQSGVSYSGIELSPGSIATDSAQSADRTPARSSIATGGSSDADSLEVNLRVTGTLDQLNQFFDLVEKTAPVSTIIALSLTPQGRPSLFSQDQAVGATNSYEAEVTVAAAYFTRSVSAALNAALPPLTASDEQFLTEISQFTVEELAPQEGVVGGGLDDLFGVQQPPTGVSN